MSERRFNEIKSVNPKVEFLTSTTHETYPTTAGDFRIPFNCKDMTVYNSGDYVLIIEGSINLQPGQWIMYGADQGEYQTGILSFRFGALVGPGTNQYFTVIRKQYAE